MDQPNRFGGNVVTAARTRRYDRPALPLGLGEQMRSNQPLVADEVKFPVEENTLLQLRWRQFTLGRDSRVDIQKHDQIRPRDKRQDTFEFGAAELSLGGYPSHELIDPVVHDDDHVCRLLPRQGCVQA